MQKHKSTIHVPSIQNSGTACLKWMSYNVKSYIRQNPNSQWTLLQWKEKVKWMGVIWLALCELLDVNANNYIKNMHRVFQGQSSQCGKSLLWQNNRLLKCQAVPLRRQWHVVVVVLGGRVGGWDKNVFLSFNVIWAWRSFTRVTCQEISIKGVCDFLSHPYISTHKVSKRLK